MAAFARPTADMLENFSGETLMSGSTALGLSSSFASTTPGFRARFASFTARFFCFFVLPVSLPARRASSLPT